MKDRIADYSQGIVFFTKTVDISVIDNIPIDMGLTMVPKCRQTLIDNVIIKMEDYNFWPMLRMQVKAVKVPCGIIQGESDSLIIIGAHHDTVYMAQGAVDIVPVPLPWDGSAIRIDWKPMENQNIQFTCTWGEKKKDCLDYSMGR